MLIEAARTLPLLPETERIRLASRVKGVHELLLANFDELTARSYLRGIDIPVPGEPGVNALGSVGIRGLLDVDASRSAQRLLNE